jgi:hypothetical protein
MERECKCDADYNMHGINFKKAMGPPQSQKDYNVYFSAQVRGSQNRQRRFEQCVN